MLTINFDLLSKPVDPIFSMNKNEVQIYKKLVQGVFRDYFWNMKIGIIKEYKNPPDKRVVFSPRIYNYERRNIWTRNDYLCV